MNSKGRKPNTQKNIEIYKKTTLYRGDKGKTYFELAKEYECHPQNINRIVEWVKRNMEKGTIKIS